MKKKYIIISVVVIFLSLFIGTFWFLYVSSIPEPKIYELVEPEFKTITLKTVANGSISPRKEVNIKSNVSGLVEKLYVEAGQKVKVGQILAKIKIIPSEVSLNNAQGAVQKQSILLKDAQREYDRYKQLYNDSLVSEREFLSYQLNLKSVENEYQQAIKNVQLIKEGALRNSGNSNTIVKSTINGTILDIPVKEGSFVIEGNTFNEGTTIATIADLNDMIFIGKVEESEIGKVKEQMTLELTVGATGEQKVKAVLEFISPKGIIEDGAVNFEIRAAIQNDTSLFLRAGYSATADIIFERKDSVLAISESTLQFNEDSVFIEVETKQSQVFKKVLVETGISDGIFVEIINGVKAGDKIKVAQMTGGVVKKEGGTSKRARTSVPRKAS